MVALGPDSATIPKQRVIDTVMDVGSGVTMRIFDGAMEGLLVGAVEGYAVSDKTIGAASCIPGGKPELLLIEAFTVSTAAAPSTPLPDTEAWMMTRNVLLRLRRRSIL